MTPAKKIKERTAHLKHHLSINDIALNMQVPKTTLIDWCRTRPKVFEACIEQTLRDLNLV